MKKIIIAVLAVVMATCAQAVTMKWGSGTLYTAASKTGGNSSTKVSNAGVEVVMSVYLVSEGVYSEISTGSQSAIMEAVSGLTANYTGVNRNSTTQALIPAITVTDSSFAGSTPFYSVITVEYTDANYGYMYMATVAAGTTPSSGTKNNSILFDGKAWIGQEEDVPEPTSGILFLLGMAGLALRRRRA